jgi:serine protease Do
MRTSIPIYVVAAAFLLSNAGLMAASDELTDAVRTAVSQAEASVVRIRMVGARHSESSVGVSLVTTGVVISADGHIITSAFALQGNPQAILVETQDGSTTEAAVVATDHLRKLVLLKAGQGNWRDPVIAPQGEVRIGQWVIAMGRMYASEASSLSVGIVSALNRIHGLVLQTDAKISPVNYGGPLVDLKGRIAGILVPMSPRGREDASAGVEWYDSGIGFAIPIEEVIETAHQMKTEGDRYPGRFGISLTATSPLAGRVSVRSVHPGGPADVAGIKPGDEFVTVNGVSISRPGILESIIGRSYAGSRMTADVRRDGELLKMEVELAWELSPLSYGFVGLLPIAGADREDESNDVTVVVLPDSPAAAAGLSGTIQCRSLAGQRTDSIASLVTTAGTLQPGASPELEYWLDDQENVQSVTLQVANLPGTVSAVPSGVLHALETDDEPNSEPADTVQRTEISVGKSGKCIVFQFPQAAAPRDGRPRLPGVVVLCSENADDEPAILRRWEKLIRTHNLQVVIPVNPEGSLLSSGSARLIGQCLARMRESHPYDPLRVVAVADTGQIALAAALALTPRSPVRGAAFVKGWFSPDVGLDLGLTRRAMLLADQPTDRESNALQQQAVEMLREAGVRVFESPDQPTGNAPRSIERHIADWTLLIKAL